MKKSSSSEQAQGCLFDQFRNSICAFLDIEDIHFACGMIQLRISKMRLGLAAVCVLVYALHR